ncbi:9721_t:CDS:2 [Ambispora leptoticha]|uniref:9721_t:CDS:1 n=1 Tax=Ambispora leptoticha TaxID=144679 RepID=A0A9N9DFI3_9GLOM|nr:9721_t:CDS:2 [Ambispora leptoticha]
MLSDVDNPGPGFEYFLSTPCGNWNLLEYFEAWTANYGLDKANLVRRFNTQLQIVREHGTDEEKRNAMRLELQFKFVIVCYPWDFVSAWLWTSSPLQAAATHGTSSPHGYGLRLRCSQLTDFAVNFLI